jgi:hypothetical protein
MNDLGANILAVMESSNLGKMSVHILNKQSRDIGVDLEKITEDDIQPLVAQLGNVLPFFLGDETKDLLTKIRKHADNGMAVV